MESSPKQLTVLVEQDDPSIAWAEGQVLAEAGYEVITCDGPSAIAGGCPLVGFGRCGLLDAADVVVHGLWLGDADNREVLGSILERAPDKPVVVETTPLTADHYEALLETVRELPYPTCAEDLVAAVEHAGRSVPREQSASDEKPSRT